MTAGLLALVLGAAFLHASWNALVKAADERASVFGLLSLGHVALGVALAAGSPLPAPQSWPYLAASTVIHFGYYALLNLSYRLGDLSLIYPVARGIVPVLVALGATVGAGEALGAQVWAGIVAVSAGVIALSGGLRRGALRGGAIASALLTGLTIAAYSLVDGLGVRLSGAPAGYIGWLFILEIFVTLFVFSSGNRRLWRTSPRTLAIGLAGGLISASAYAMVIWAKALAPLGVVSALRETSVLFAALIGVTFLGERPWRRRIGAAVTVALGVALIALA
jgi:drug/metabolite transporter (DMT)-like permease